MAWLVHVGFVVEKAALSQISVFFFLIHCIHNCSVSGSSCCLCCSRIPDTCNALYIVTYFMWIKAMHYSFRPFVSRSNQILTLFMTDKAILAILADFLRVLPHTTMFLLPLSSSFSHCRWLALQSVVIPRFQRTVLSPSLEWRCRQYGPPK